MKSNLVTPRNGEPLIAAIQDFITGTISVFLFKFPPSLFKSLFKKDFKIYDDFAPS